MFKVGISFLLFGSILVYFLIQPSLMKFPVLMVYSEDTRATITNSSSTNMTINDEAVYKYFYSYSTADETRENSFLYTGKLNHGEEIDVTYSKLFPSVSAPLDKLNYISLITFIFPLAGIVFLSISFKEKRKLLRVFRFGTKVSGKLIDRRETGRTINKQPVYEYIFEIADHTGFKQLTSYKSLQNERLERAGLKDILYDEKTNRSFPVDSLPNYLKKRT